MDHGLGGVELITRNAHVGLKPAWRAVFGGVPWQRCQFHLQQNTQAYVPRQNMKLDVASDIRAFFNTPYQYEAEELLAKIEKKSEKKASRLANWIETNIPEGLTVFAFPGAHHRRIRTANSLERLN